MLHFVQSMVSCGQLFFPNIISKCPKIILVLKKFTLAPYKLNLKNYKPLAPSRMNIKCLQKKYKKGLQNSF